jgi:Right handed beta helix region/Bacterial TSP3 repeat
MRRLSHTFALSRFHLAIAFSAVALFVAPSVAAATADVSLGGPASHKSVQAVSVTKRAVTVTRRAKAPARIYSRTYSWRTDSDNDGLSNWTERHRTGTDPQLFDTDGDGFGDGAEVRAGTYPLDSASAPAGPPAPPPPADTTAPNTTISSGPSGTTTSMSASLGFGSNESRSTFQCSLDSGIWSACTSPKTYSGLVVGSHTFSVKATDTAGNVDATPATRSWTVQTTAPPTDTTAPNTTITSSPAGATTSTSASLGFSSTENGSTFQCKLDSGAWIACSSAKTYSGLAVGAHAFSVKATDAAGNTDPSPATDNWTVQAVTPPADTTAPDTTISSGPSGATTANSASLDFSSSESGSTYQCSLDSGAWSACTPPKTYGSLAVGSHAFSVKATDAAGNTDASPATRSWTVQTEAPPTDTTPPDTTISSGSSGTTTSTAASFSFSATESGSTFQCKLDSGTWGSCTSPKAYSGLAVGAHAFSVKATDAAGNADATPATNNWTVQSTESGGGGSCTQTLSSGANLSSAVSSAAGGAVICLGSGSYSVNVTKANKSSMVTVKPAAGAAPTLAYSMLNQATNLRFQELKFTGGIEALGPASKLQFVDNEFVGPFGFHANGQAQSNGTQVTDVLIDGNSMHNLDYTGTQGTANGYGVTASNGAARFTITNNTIKSPASDYIQFASPETVLIDHNTFLGPSLLGSHQDHQDLVQIFGGGDNVTFTNNVARNTETQESLLFQEGAFTNVVIENNLFDHDSRGYTCQLYQSKGMIFRDNTVVGSHWGCLFRDLASSGAGSGYQIDHNIFTNTAEGSDISTEGRAGSWGTYDYNVSEDGSAGGSHSVRNWSPSWSDTTDYTPLGLPFAAGYRP